MQPVASSESVGTLSGLSQQEASARLQRVGPNELSSHEGPSVWRTLRSVLTEPMLILLLACGSLYLLLGDRGEAALLFTFVLLVIAITLWQERRTERAVAALRSLQSPRALVRRDGRDESIAAREVVPGDLLVLSEGVRVAADATLRQGDSVLCDESLLTGESVAVRKQPSLTVPVEARPGGDDLPQLFMGTMVVRGSGLAEVTATGLTTEVGKIGRALSEIEPPRTPLDLEMKRLVRGMATLGVALCVLVVLLRGVLHREWVQGLLAGLAMAMSVLPEELPMILTVFLSIGAWRIAHHNVLLRRPGVIEALGAATVLCSDKTGTLTQNRMTVDRVSVGGVEHSLSSLRTPIDPSLLLLLRAARLSSQAAPSDPMELALVEALQKVELSVEQELPKFRREYPLVPALLAVTRAYEQTDGHLLFCKGAPEAVSELCRLSDEEKQTLLVQTESLAKAGLRVLAVGTARVGAELPESPQQVKFELCGLLSFLDPLRPEVPQAVAECHRAGVRVLMITGDYPATALAIAEQAGIAVRHGVLSGPEMAQLTDEELKLRVASVSVFARMVPEQKLRLVKALKDLGGIVAMTGDGVNDAPALKAAHIGIAMGKRGTDVARESAALILADDNFASIVAAMRLGRRIFDNLRKAVAYTFAVHVPIAGLSLLSPLLSWPLLLLPAHIAVLEMIIDPSCGLIFEGTAAEPHIMDRPPRPVGQPMVTGVVLFLAILQGAMVLAGCVGAYYFAAHLGYSTERLRAVVFSTLVFANLGLIIVSRSWTESALRTLWRGGKVLWTLILATVGLGALVLGFAPLQRLFSLAPLSLGDIGACLAMAATSVAWFEVVKLGLERRSCA
jgi:Ca2+-transporting ATPase